MAENWQPVGTQAASIHINKKSGSIFWNARVHQMMGYPTSVRILYDESANSIGMMDGLDYIVQNDDDNEYKAEVREALEECGLEFPLDENITGVPDWPIDSRNMAILCLE